MRRLQEQPPFLLRMKNGKYCPGRIHKCAKHRKKAVIMLKYQGMLTMEKMTGKQKERLVERFHAGHCTDAYRFFGAHFTDRAAGRVCFTVYAPHARRVSVVGSFTGWDDRPCEMERTGFSGIWMTEIEGVRSGDTYKFRIEGSGGSVQYKADPYAFSAEKRPATASVVYDLSCLRWTDEAWMAERTRGFDRPVSIYEVYAGAWQKNRPTYRSLAAGLIPYVSEMGFTHIELMPISEHPYDGSWGYQVSGYFAVTSRYGSPQDFAWFVNECHKAGIGVVLDIVPVHFAKDSHGLARFDGEPLYEYKKQYDAQSPWGTLNFDLWNEEVRSFLMSVCAFWADAYHVDGLRLDAVSHMIFWGGDRNRGTNEGSLQFVRRLNYYMHRDYPSVMMIAEDSSDFPRVTGKTEDGGLGFDYKWDLGWMNDTLQYYATDPLFRIWDHHRITFSMDYFWSERFICPLSHDENVHGKKTIADRMWGDYDTKFTEARNLYAYMFAHPGKKLIFAGSEIAMFREFDETRCPDWFLLDYPRHEAFCRFFRTLVHLYRNHSALYKCDYEAGGFQWLERDNARQSVFSFARRGGGETVICVMNLTAQSYENYRICVPYRGVWKEILNTDDISFGGAGEINDGLLTADGESGFDTESYLTIRLASFAAVWLLYAGDAAVI